MLRIKNASYFSEFQHKIHRVLLQLLYLKEQDNRGFQSTIKQQKIIEKLIDGRNDQDSLTKALKSLNINSNGENTNNKNNNNLDLIKALLHHAYLFK